MRKRELAKVDGNGRSVKMLSPILDKNEGAYPGGGVV